MSRYAEHDLRETQLWALCESIRAHDLESLPGAVEQGTNTGRMCFQLNGQQEWRYFPTHTAAYKAKKNYSGLWSPCWLQFWHHKELIWMSGD